MTSITVLFWNVNKLANKATEITTCIERMVDEHDVNVIILAEANAEYADKLRLVLGKPWVLKSLANLNPKQIERSGVIFLRLNDAVISTIRQEIITVAEEEYSRIEAASRTERAVPRGRTVFLPQQKLLVAGVHLLSQKEANEARRTIEAGKVYEAIRDKRNQLGAANNKGNSKKPPPPVPCVIVGDFNLHPYELAIREGFKAHPARPSDTRSKEYQHYYNPYASLWGDVEVGQLKGSYYFDGFWWMYDYALFSPDLISRLDKAFWADANQKLVKEHIRNHSLTPSDHLPVLFRLKPPS